MWSCMKNSMKKSSRPFVCAGHFFMTLLFTETLLFLKDNTVYPQAYSHLQATAFDTQQVTWWWSHWLLSPSSLQSWDQDPWFPPCSAGWEPIVSSCPGENYWGSAVDFIYDYDCMMVDIIYDSMILYFSLLFCCLLALCVF